MVLSSAYHLERLGEQSRSIACRQCGKSGERRRLRFDTLERSALGLIQEGANAARRRVPEDVMACMNQYGRFNPVPREGADTSDGIRNTDLVADKASIAAFCKAVDG